MKRFAILGAVLLLLTPLNLLAQCSGDSCTLDRNLPQSLTSVDGSRNVNVACGLLGRIFGRRGGCSNGSCNVTQRNPTIDAAPVPTGLTTAIQKQIHQQTVGISAVGGDSNLGLTGTVIDVGATHTTILTNAHGFFKKYDKVYVSYPQGIAVEGRVIAQNDKYDAALIEAPRPQNIIPARLSDPQLPKKLTHVGYKADSSLWLEGGEFVAWVSASHNVGLQKRVPARKTDYHQLGKTQLAMTGHVAEQESGGGVYDEQGRLAGMVWGGETLKDGRSIVYAVNMNQIRSFLEDHSDDIAVTAGERWAAPERGDNPFRSVEQLADAGENDTYTTFPRRQPQVQVQVDYKRLLDMLAKDERFRGPAGINGTNGTDGANGVSPTAAEVAAELTDDAEFRTAVKGDPGKIDNGVVKEMTTNIYTAVMQQIKVPTVDEIKQATLAEINIPTAEEVAAKVKVPAAQTDPEAIAEIVNNTIANLEFGAVFVDEQGNVIGERQAIKPFGKKPQDLGLVVGNRRK